MPELLIVDDHPLFLEGLRQFLATHAQAEVRCASSVEQALVMLDAKLPDAMILDVMMKDGTGLQLLSKIRARGIRTPVILLTVMIQPEQTLEALKLGCSGITLKESNPQELLACVETVLAGGTRVDARVMELALMHSVSAGQPHRSPTDILTEREKELAGLIRKGLRNREIADRLGLSEGTVKVHVHSIFKKLKVRSRAELIVNTNAG
jgi:two-component system nitrate/nitrite response regulator NarP